MTVCSPAYCHAHYRYVLLKERNMLLTVKQEANRELYVMPGPERLRKVRRSMARIKVVLFERVSGLG